VTNTPPGDRSATGTADRVLDVAERLAQTRGFNGFSYADISEEVGITKASLHYHFRTKAELGRRLIARYSETFRLALEAIGASNLPAGERLKEYARLYADVLRGGRMCLCGMLAAEYTTLPVPMQEELRRFFDLNEDWLARQVDDGRAAGTLPFDGEARDAARMLMGALEGAMLVARSYDDVGRFESAAGRLLHDLEAGGAVPLAPPPG
jgi:TetR/AcrR family transcriptional repressor of nem operon